MGLPAYAVAGRPAGDAGPRDRARSAGRRRRRSSRSAAAAACPRRSSSPRASPRPGRRARRCRTSSPGRPTTGGVTLVGPNCMGVLCTSAHLNAVGFVTLRPEPGPLSVISQSGNIGTQLLMTAERRGIGVEKFVSSGNQATTDANDLLEYLAGDPRDRRHRDVPRGDGRRPPLLRAGPRDDTAQAGRRHARRPQRARTPAASSHTGALAGSAEVFRAAARQAGVILAARPRRGTRRRRLARLPAAARRRPRRRGHPRRRLGRAHGRPPGGARRSSSPQLPPDVLAAVDELLPPFWSRGNPIDLVATVSRRRA